MARDLKPTQEMRLDSCKQLYEAALKTPVGARAILVAREAIAEDIIKMRMPGVGSYLLTQQVSQQAYDKLRANDLLGAAGDYAATVAIGAVSWFPMAGDLVTEFLRKSGANIPASPLRNAYDTVVGVEKFCEYADAQIMQRLSSSGTNYKLPLPTLNTTEAQDAAVGRMVARVAAAVEEANAENINGRKPLIKGKFRSGRMFD